MKEGDSHELSITIVMHMRIDNCQAHQFSGIFTETDEWEQYRVPDFMWIGPG